LGLAWIPDSPSEISANERRQADSRKMILLPGNAQRMPRSRGGRYRPEFHFVRGSLATPARNLQSGRRRPSVPADRHL
jgi:hypothetical protein